MKSKQTTFRLGRVVPILLCLGSFMGLPAAACAPGPVNHREPETKSPAGGLGSESSTGAALESGSVVQLEVEILRELPHNPGSYTQGLLMRGGEVFESRGQVGKSGIDVWNPESGEIIRSVDLEDELFGEGLARVGDTLWQVTWQSGEAIRWTLDLEEIERTSFAGEGWGLEFDGKRLVMSDGTHVLRFFDPETFEFLGALPIARGAGPQDSINELEMIAGSTELFANVYQTDEIVRIDLDSGRVTGVADLSNLLTSQEARRADVLNGIAYWPERDSYLITGKHWPKSFEVRFKQP